MGEAWMSGALPDGYRFRGTIPLSAPALCARDTSRRSTPSSSSSASSLKHVGEDLLQASRELCSCQRDTWGERAAQRPLPSGRSPDLEDAVEQRQSMPAFDAFSATWGSE